MYTHTHTHTHTTQHTHTHTHTHTCTSVKGYQFYGDRYWMRVWPTQSNRTRDVWVAFRCKVSSCVNVDLHLWIFTVRRHYMIKRNRKSIQVTAHSMTFTNVCGYLIAHAYMHICTHTHTFTRTPLHRCIMHVYVGPVERTVYVMGPMI